MNEEPVGKLCGRPLSAADLESIRAAVREADPPQRAEIARRVCTALNWVDVQGRPKLMSCRVGLLRLHRAGLIALPAPRNGNGNGRALQPRCDALPEAATLSGSVQALAGLRLETVVGAADSRLWNALIARWHYLGYMPLSGAQLRYLICWDGGVLGALGFGAAAWKVAARATARRRAQQRSISDPAVGAGEESRLQGLGDGRGAGRGGFSGALRCIGGAARDLRRAPALSRHLLPGGELAVSGGDRRTRQTGPVRSCRIAP